MCEICNIIFSKSGNRGNIRKSMGADNFFFHMGAGCFGRAGVTGLGKFCCIQGGAEPLRRGSKI